MILYNIPPKFQSDPTKSVEDTFYKKKLTTAQRTHTDTHTTSDGYSPRSLSSPGLKKGIAALIALSMAVTSSVEVGESSACEVAISPGHYPPRR